VKVFLLTYERKSGELLSQRVYDRSDYGTAQADLLVEERAHPAPGFEVVLLEAESEAVLRMTHIRYFELLWPEPRAVTT
jgi:hypothetical protein